ncbi:MAG: hypothetical protein EXS15_04795 [Phycisphaerales bacterium]|nr:hypothetical protein [Phycisphaerales bacterium]
MKVLLFIVGGIGALLFARAAKIGAVQSPPLDSIIAWALSIASLISAVWLVKLKLPAWAAILAAMAVALNVLVPVAIPPDAVGPFNIVCGVLCSACVVRNWE